jgi:hypothetical protein
MMKFSWAISRVKWLSGEKTNVSKTSSVLVLRVLVWLWLGKNILSNLYLSGGRVQWPLCQDQLPGKQQISHITKLIIM